MRHYTGKHGVLEAFLREIIDAGLELPPNPKHANKANRRTRNNNRNKSSNSNNNSNNNNAQQQQQQQQPPMQLQLAAIPVQQPPNSTNLVPSPATASSGPPTSIRRKRPSHNSTGASSPESLQDQDEENQQPQLALVSLITYHYIPVTRPALRKVSHLSTSQRGYRFLFPLYLPSMNQS